MHPLEARLSERANQAGLTLTDSLQTTLLAYYDLLFRWNSTINLTSISDPDEAIDRLLLEPVAAARYLPMERALMDLGSGGGSPAIPLGLALGSPRLVMVESKGRKAAFLREAARAVGLPAVVEAVRFEALAEDPRYQGQFEILSMRAVRLDERSLAAAATFLVPGGAIALFVSAGASPVLPTGLKLDSRAPLLTGSELVVLRQDVPRETVPV